MPKAASPADAVSPGIFDQIVAEHTRHTVGTWLAFLSENAYEQVAAPLTVVAGSATTEFASTQVTGIAVACLGGRRDPVEVRRCDVDGHLPAGRRCRNWTGAAMTTLSGPLADDLWRIGHEDTTGNPWIDAHSMALGLAAALLGELWLGRHVRIGQGRLEVAVDQPLPVDRLAESIVRLLAREASDFTLASWLTFLARDAYEQVTRRMAEAGHSAPRRRGLTGAAWVATNTSQALAPTLHLRYRIGKGYPLVTYELALAGLLSACGLEKALLYPATEPAILRERLAEWLRWPDMPPALVDLLKHTSAAAGRAVMTARTRT